MEHQGLITTGNELCASTTKQELSRIVGGTTALKRLSLSCCRAHSLDYCRGSEMMMNFCRLQFLWAVLFVTFFASIPSHGNETGKTDPGNESSRTESTKRCPGKNFQEFLEAFAEDPGIQRLYTRIPLAKVTSVDAVPERKFVTSLNYSDDFEFPVFPNKGERQAQGLKLRFEHGWLGRKVRVYAPDSGYQVDYFFFKERGCWELFRIENFST